MVIYSYMMYVEKIFLLRTSVCNILLSTLRYGLLLEVSVT